MSHYLPVLIVSVAAGIPDDASFQPLPSGQVDYLSHEWQEEDVWRSWRNMTKQKNEIANGVRLENASWRTWWKQRNNLKTISPETLNWLKDSDVTWLYGPLHTATEWAPPSKSDHSRQNSISSPSSSTNLDRLALQSPRSGEVLDQSDNSHHYSHNHTPTMTKPILKHRTISEMLTSALAPSSGSGSGSGGGSGSSYGWVEEEHNDYGFNDLEDENDNDEGDVRLEQAENWYEHSTTSQNNRKPPSRPPLTHTKSDTNILRRFGTGAQHLRRKQAQLQAAPRVATQRANFDAAVVSNATSASSSGPGSSRDVGDVSIRTDNVVAGGNGLSGSQRTTSSGNLVDMPTLQAHATGFLPIMHVDNNAFASSPSSLHAPLSYFAQGSALRSHSGSSAGSSRSDSVEDPSRRFSESVVPNTSLPQKRHITFNPYVEQCIALEAPQVKMRSMANGVSGGGGNTNNGNGSVGFGVHGSVMISEDGAEVEHDDRIYGFDDSYEYVDEGDEEEEEGIVDDGYDQDEEDGLYENVGKINGAALARSKSRSQSRSGSNEEADDEDDDEEDEDIIQMRPRPSIARRYSASAIGVPRLARSDNNSSSSSRSGSGRPPLRRTSTSTATTHRSASSEKEPVSIAYIAPTVLKPGSGSRGMSDEDEDDDDDDEVEETDNFPMGFGVEPGITMYADGPYSYVYGASYTPGRYELNERDAGDFGSNSGGEVTYHHRPSSSEELFGTSSVGGHGSAESQNNGPGTSNKYFTPPIVGSPMSTPHLLNDGAPERHYFEQPVSARGNISSSTSTVSGTTTRRDQPQKKPKAAIIPEGGTIEIVDDVREDIDVPTVRIEDRGRGYVSQPQPQLQYYPSSNDRRSPLLQPGSMPASCRSSSLSPDSKPPTNPRVASLKSESNYKQQQQPVYSSDSRSTSTPTIAIPTPGISPSHQSVLSSSPDAHDFSMLTPPDSSPSRGRGRSQCISPVNGSGYVTSGSATSPSAFSSDSRSLSESRSESRGRSYTRGSSCSDPDRLYSRSRSSGGTGSPIGSVSPNSKVNGIFNYSTGYGTHSGREIKDGRGVKLYRKTSEDVIGTRERERGRDRDRRLSESLSPPDGNSNSNASATSGKNRDRGSGTAISSPPTRNQSSSLLYQSYTVNNFGQQRPKNDSELEDKNSLPSSALVQANGKIDADYVDGGSSSSQSTVNGFVSTAVPASIPEEDEARFSVGPSTPIREAPPNLKIISSPPITPPAKSPKHSRSQSLSSPPTSASVSASSVAAPGIHSRSSSITSPTTSQPSSPAVQEDAASGSFVGRATDIMSSARGFLGSLWN